MERFSRREGILLGYNLQNQRSSTSPSTPKRNSDIDFNDVFGGPPRRSSIQEMRYDVRELQDLSGVEKEDEEAAPSCAWPRVNEKPVFGEENISWRRYPSNDFFDDIFGGDESQSCTPRRHEIDPFSASRVWSPARPLRPKPEPFGTSSIPAAFSLPAKLTKCTELPTFGFPTTRTLNNNVNDDTSNGLNSWDSPATPLSRFSSQAGQGKEGFKNDRRPSSGQSLLSQDKADKQINLEQHSPSGEVAPSSGQFHFSIYKWASKGMPLVMPLRTERNSRTKEKAKIERCSSAKERMVSENTIQNDSLFPYTGSSLIKSRKQEEGSASSISTQNGASIKETAPPKPQSETLSSLHSVVKDVPSNVMTHSLSETDLSGKIKEEPIHANRIHKPRLRSLHTLFNESGDNQDYNEMATSRRGKESKEKNLFEWKDQIAVNPKKREETTVAASGVEVSKVTSHGSSSLDENIGNGHVKGKVKEFVRIFNQEPIAKPGIDNKSRIQGSEYKHRGVLRTKNEVEDCSEQSKKENSGIGTASKSGHRQDEIPASAVPDSSDVAGGDKDESFHGNFQVKELDQGENEVLQSQNNEEIQVIDAKIRQWSNGKEVNIRSLLSTLQYVLWSESGWKPVPLVDIIEGNAVKRTYQRALLSLHPDKLQQKGATSYQKYIAEKVYDILQEAWTHFSLLGAI
ncbi:hypothetical protein L6164_024739 [Bauhinia variegata]|uniref:Uncharacterized protein n=1 Tax=Bauhinia variegata TaxID=167791 RepID=A0ACB9LZE9_BAUVA|nr:hypothetical protein L6164_024739 [Bauhinia variegata]